MQRMVQAQCCTSPCKLIFRSRWGAERIYACLQCGCWCLPHRGWCTDNLKQKDAYWGSKGNATWSRAPEISACDYTDPMSLHKTLGGSPPMTVVVSHQLSFKNWTHLLKLSSVQEFLIRVFPTSSPQVICTGKSIWHWAAIFGNFLFSQITFLDVSELPTLHFSSNRKNTELQML